MTGRWAEGFERDPEARPRDLAGIDRVAHGDRFVATADIPGTREALLQHRAGENGRIEGTIDRGMRHPVFRVVGAARQEG